jgi:two-component system response regulator YesN
MKKVLIVEDEYRSREGLKKLIEHLNMGYTVIGMAEDGLEGLQLIQTLEPDIVFVDIQMPKLSGLELMKQAKAAGTAKNCRFIILSGYANFSYAQEAMRQGASEYLLKPATISDIRNVLEHIGSTKNKKPENTTEDANKYSDTVQFILDKIHSEYGTQLRLESIAESLHLTVPYISNVFSEETGETFSDCLKRIRMEKAKELLNRGELKIYEVSCAVGFSDQKYFSKVFHEYTGVSPKKYAQSIAINNDNDQMNNDCNI